MKPFIKLKWRAVYIDPETDEVNENSEVLEQFESDGTENKYEDIDRVRLGRFDLLTMDNEPVYSVYLHPGQRLIWRRRVFMDPVAGHVKNIIYVVGWVQTITTPNGPKDIYAFNYIHQDGSVSLDHSRDNINIRPQEM